MNDLATGADRLDLLRTFLRIVDAGGKISHTLPKNKPGCSVVLRAQCDQKNAKE